MRRLVCKLRGHRWRDVLDQVGPHRYRVAVACRRCKVRPSEPSPHPDLDVLLPTVLAILGAAGLAWAVWGQW